MIRFSKDQCSSIFFFGLGITVSLCSLKYGHGMFSAPGPGFIGFWSGIAISFFGLIGFFVTLKKGSSKKTESMFGTFWFKSLIILLSLIGYTTFLNFLGFLVCTFLFMFSLLWLIEAHDWKLILVGSVSTAMASYLVFHVWLKTQLPMGILKYLIY